MQQMCLSGELVFMQARAGIREVHFLPFNPVDKRTALTYIDGDGNWHRASKGAPEQVFLFFPIFNMPQSCITVSKCKRSYRHTN